MATATTLAPVRATAEAAPEPALRSFYCSGCGRHHFRYRPDTLGREAYIAVRCRCKTTTELRGADVWALLEALSHGKGD